MTRVVQSNVGSPVVATKRVDFTYNQASQFDTVTRYANSAGTKLVATSTTPTTPSAGSAAWLIPRARPRWRPMTIRTIRVRSANRVFNPFR
jgi:hypothetical protein